MVDHVTRVISALDNENKAVGVLMDLKKEFDCLLHKLFEIVYKLGI